MKEELSKFKAMMDEKRKEAAQSIESGFDLYSSRHSPCEGDKEECQECLNDHGGLCVAREILKDAFYAGASVFLLGIEEAGKTGKAGAMAEAVERMSDELGKYGETKMKEKIARGLVDLLRKGPD